MSYGSMHIELVKKLQEFQDIEVAQVLFVEMEIPGKSCWGYYCIEVGKVQAKQKFTNLSLSGCLSATNIQIFQYLSSFGHGHFLLIL